MANVSRTVDIIFYGDDKLTKTVNGITGSLDTMDRAVQKVADPFAQLGKGILAADAALATLAGTGLALAIRESGKFGDSFNEIATIAHVSGESLKQFRDDVLSYGQVSTSSIADVNSAIYTAISAGVSYKDSISTVSEAERLAIAGRADLESTTRLLASTLNAYGESSDQAGRYSDIFFKTVELGLTTIPELADSLALVSNIAASAGVPIETLMAALAALTASGLKTENAITALKATISNIIKPSSEAEKAAAAMGLEFGASALKTKGLETVLREVQEATHGDTQAITQLFGNVRGLSAVLNLASDSSGRFAKSLTDIKDSAGATQAAYDLMAENFSLTNQRLINNVQAVMIKLGDQVKGNYSDIADGLIVLFQSVGQAVDAGTFNDIFALFDDFTNQLTDFLGKVAEALPAALAKADYSGVIDALRETYDLFGNLFNDVDFGNADDLADIIQEILDTIEGLIYVSNSMINTFIDVFNLVKTGVQDFNNLDAATQDTFGKILASAIILKEAGTYLGTAILSMKSSGIDLQGSFNVLLGTFQTVYESVMGIMDALAVGVAMGVSYILHSMDALTLGLLSPLGEAAAAVDEFAKGGLTDMVDRFKGAGEGIAQIFDGANTMVSKTEKTVSEVAAAVESVPDTKTIDWGMHWDAMEADRTISQIEETIPKETEVQIFTPVQAILDEAELKKQQKIIAKQMEIKAKLDVAGIEADTKRIEAAFKSVDTSIDSTGDLIGSLFGKLSDTNVSMLTRFTIEDQIREENERREESLALQKRMTEAQIAVMQARVESLNRGDPIITVDGAGLQPHLEAIMFELLSAIQVRVNEDQEDFLLGVS